MNIVSKTVNGIDEFQRRHTVAGFLYAVVKKYGDDEASYQGALITYYAFLALFPLLMVAVTIVQLVFGHNAHVRAKFLNSITHYFPIVGAQLGQSVHSHRGTGVALVLGLLVTFYGARGVADAARHAFDHLWHVPKRARDGFPVAAIKSLSMIVIGGIGLVISGFLSSYATSFGHAPLLRIGLTVISLIVLIMVLFAVFKIGVSKDAFSANDAWRAASIAGIGLQILQTFGGYLITHELKNASNTSGVFAFVLVILFWLYLQVEVVLYSIEITTVRRLHLWPRSLAGKPTAADQVAHKMLVVKTNTKG